jgi:ligand-binding sensor domain-containing protein/serine phosphatase RsbU (regulator of sigma subunit)
LYYWCESLTTIKNNYYFYPMRNFAIILFSLVIIWACNSKKKNQTQSSGPKVVEAMGYVVPKDSMAAPKVIMVDESKLKKVPVGKPKFVDTNTNVHVAGVPQFIKAGTPRVCTPGQDTFLLPKVLPALDSSFVAGIPEVVITKDPRINDNNPQSFAAYSKLQGLKHEKIACILEDRSGNLWFGTGGGGVCKYDGQHFTHFTDKEGLSNNFVRSILEDKSGNIWFGTYGGGVTKYDGLRFTHFTVQQGLSNNIVLSILEDKSGNIWFGTGGGGVSKYEPSKIEGQVGYFTHFTVAEGLSYNTVMSILEDKSGNLWFGTEGGGVSKFDGKSFTHFNEALGLSNNIVWSILEDKSGNIWFGTQGGGVSKYNGNSFTNFTEAAGLSHNVVLSIIKDKSGNIWFGTGGGGVSKYDGQCFINFTDKEGLSDNVVFSILEDKSGNIWFGTRVGGVSKYNGQRFTHYTDKEGLSNNHVKSILEDKSGNLWFGTYGGAVSKYDGQRFTHFTEAAGLSDNVRSILEDKSGNIWFGTYGGGVVKYDGQHFTHFTEAAGLSNNIVLSILEDQSGNLWFGTGGGGVSKYDGQYFTHFTIAEGLSNNNVYSIIEDKSGNLWFGTQGGGVSKYEPSKIKSQMGRFTHFTLAEGLNNNIVFSMLADKSGNLWFGTNGGGVSKYDGHRFIHLTEVDGLSNNFVMLMVEDKSGNIWFGTRFGLSKLTNSKLVEMNNKLKSKSIKQEDLFFKNYSYEDGFLGIGCYVNSVCESNDGTIWIGANDRLTAYHPPKVDRPSTLAPNIQLTGIQLFNENIPWTNLLQKKDSALTLGNGVSVGDFGFDSVSKWYGLPENLRLAYNNNYLTFNFIGITMMQPKKVKYQYKLDGIDENWSALTNRTEAPYGNLPHGNYTFKVKAMNSEGYWSEPFEYTFTIRPPWWKTWWAYGIYFVTIIGSIWTYIKWRERSLKQRQVELETTVEERTAELVEEKKVVVTQKEVLEEKQKEILDSIEYAKRIQATILPSVRVVKKYLEDSFILYLPKDIVAGDFYWMESPENDNTVYFAVCDCTGHGVPGAMVSVVCHNALNKSLKEFGARTPAKILDKVAELVIEDFNKNADDNDEIKDGMDASICALDVENGNLQWAGANNPLWMIRKGQDLMETRADKQPVGRSDERHPYTNHSFQLQKGDLIYLITDGYADQFGGEKNKKFQKANLKTLLFSIHTLPMEEQRKKLYETFMSWKGSNEQIDDVCIIGVRV